MASSRAPPAPPWGPGFLRLDTWPYRAEYAAATVAIVVVLFVWRLAILHDFPAFDIGLAVFWMVWPDLVAFVPIGFASRGAREWPSWGPTVYNATHSLLVWGAVFVAWSALAGTIVWPLLGWAGHITADRTFGYYLRAPRLEAPVGPT